jgi:hypothetical protein
LRHLRKDFETIRQYGASPPPMAESEDSCDVGSDVGFRHRPDDLLAWLTGPGWAKFVAWSLIDPRVSGQSARGAEAS